MTPRIVLVAGEDGTPTYHVPYPASDLPPVLGRDLDLAWEAARHAAQEGRWDVERLILFQGTDGSRTALRLADQDACCWAGAIDRTLGLHTGRGLSVCVRLLALVDLLAGRRLSAEPRLLRLAAAARLTDDGCLPLSGEGGSESRVW